MGDRFYAGTGQKHLGISQKRFSHGRCNACDNPRETTATPAPVPLTGGFPTFKIFGAKGVAGSGVSGSRLRACCVQAHGATSFYWGS